MSTHKTRRPQHVELYDAMVPSRWDETMDAHRQGVREAILDATWGLVDEHGLLSVTMAQVAEHAGVGRATLYKYFPNVEAILVAHHDRHVAGHLQQLRSIADDVREEPEERLNSLLHAYGFICFQRRGHGSHELLALLHRHEHVVDAEEQIRGLFRDALVRVADANGLRAQASPDELAYYCLHALGAAGSVRSEAAVARLVAVTLRGLVA